MTKAIQGYLELKKTYPNHIVFVEAKGGEWYEAFFTDAELASKALGFVLTGRDYGEPQRAPMCSIDIHLQEICGEILNERGYDVLFCERAFLSLYMPL